MSKKIKPLLVLALIAFLLNFVWEISQAPLYDCYDQFLHCMWLCFKASLGDVVWVLLLYGIFRVSHSKTAVVLAGLAIAIGVELHALQTGRWAYAESMPLIPFLSLGLTPLLQMAILPLVSIYITDNFAKFKPYTFTRILLWLGALFFLTEFFLHFFGLPILEHDAIFLYTHDRYIALYALTNAFLLTLVSTDPKKYRFLGHATLIFLLFGLLNAAWISQQGGYSPLFPVISLDKDLSALGLNFLIWYALTWTMWGMKR